MKSLRHARLAAVSMLAVGLAACGGASAPQYYSLQGAGGSTQPLAAQAPVNASYAISVEPVVVPEQVARPQIVVAAASRAEVVPLNAALWAGPLEAQIRNALADALTRRLNVVDVGQSGAGEGLPVWRIYVDVQRFDSFYDQSIQHDVVWRMTPQGMPKGARERLCSAQVGLPVGTGMSALVEGHRQALETLADIVARTLPVGSAAGKPPAHIPLPEGAVFKGCVG